MPPSSSHVERLFRSIDADGSGGITRAEMQSALRRSGIWCPESRLDRIFADMDANADGVITLPEFSRAYAVVDTPEFHGLHSVVVGAAALCASPDKPVVPETGSRLQQAKYLLAGCTAGLLSKTAVAPLERVLVMQQCDTRAKGDSMVGALRKIVGAEGVRGLWKGNGVACLRQVPFAGFVCFMYTVLTTCVLGIPASVTVGDDGGAAATAQRLGAGALAGALAAAFTYPLEVLKTRAQQAGSPTVRGVVTQLRAAGPGRSPLMSGLRPTLWTVAPFVAVDKAAHATLRDKAAERGLCGTSVILACGAASGLIGQTVVHSLDVVRKRMQAGHGYTGVWDAVTSIVRTEGAGGLAKGLLTAYCKAAPAMAVTYCTIDATVRLIETEL